MKPDISAIIVNYNDGRRVVSCIDSLLAADNGRLLEVIVVDNDSADDSRQHFEIARTRWSDSVPLRWIQQSVNVGFGSGANRGVADSTGELVLVLNPDVRVSAGAPGRLANVLDREPRVGLVAPKLVNPDLTVQYSCRRHYSLPALVLRTFPFNRIFPRHRLVRRHLMLDFDHRLPRDVDWVIGACILVRRSALSSPRRMFDERYFLYFEDLDLALDLKQQGFQIRYQPEALALHVHARRSASLIPSRAKWEHLSSLVKFVLKHPRYLAGAGASR